MRIHRPLPLLYLPSEVGVGLTRLSGLEGLARSLIVTTVPLVALDRLGGKEAVSQGFTIGAVLTLAITLNVGRFEAIVARRWVMTAGILALFGAALLFTTSSATPFVVGIGLRSAAASTFSVLLTLYVMDYIGKAELTRIESNRMLYNGLAWLVGPLVGVQLAQRTGDNAPFLLSAALSLVLLAYYWWLRLGRSEVITAPRTPAPSPLASIGRFFGRRSMRIAYAISFVRATFWVALFVYGPIYVVEAGLDATAAALLLSGVASLLLFSPLIRRLADRIGSRQVIMTGFVVIAVALVGLAALGPPRQLGLIFWGLAASGGALIDVVGNIPFLRMVKPRERVAMATVFSTWREMSALVSPLLATVVLALDVAFEVYYLLIAGLCLATAGAASLLPRRL